MKTSKRIIFNLYKDLLGAWKLNDIIEFFDFHKYDTKSEVSIFINRYNNIKNYKVQRQKQICDARMLEEGM